MKKVFSLKKYVKSVYDGDYEKALESFSVNKYERGWVFDCVNKTIEDNKKNGYNIILGWCELYPETELEKEIITIINNYGFNNYSISYDYDGNPYRVCLIDNGKISGEKSSLIIYPRWFKSDGFEINENSTILYYIEKIQKLLD